MSIRIVRLGTPKRSNEGIRLGTVRRPPRGVRKNRYSLDDWFDVWLPNLAPSTQLITWARNSDLDDRSRWMRFAARYEAEMARPENSRVLDALAALSYHTNFSVGCYCEAERRCHRSILKRIFKKHDAKVAG